MARTVSEQFLRRKEFLKEYPDASGEDGVLTFNNSKYADRGTITLSQLYSARHRLKDELHLSRPADAYKKRAGIKPSAPSEEEPRTRGRKPLIPDYFIRNLAEGVPGIDASDIADEWNLKGKNKVDARYVEMRAEKLGIRLAEAIPADFDEGAVAKTVIGKDAEYLYIKHEYQHTGIPFKDEHLNVIYSDWSGWVEERLRNTVPAKCSCLSAPVLTEQVPVVTLNRLADAIKARQKGIEKEVAESMARFALNFFGYGGRILDNMLEPEDRDVFYMLEDLDLLTTEREEAILYDGREWRIHYWLLKEDVIRELTEPRADASKGDIQVSVYGDVPDEAWQRNQPVLNSNGQLPSAKK